MTNTYLIEKLRELGRIGIVNAREDCHVLQMAANRLQELREKADPKWNYLLIMDAGAFLESIEEDGETNWTNNKEDAMTFMPDEKEAAETIADMVCGQVVLRDDYNAWNGEFSILFGEGIDNESD